MSAVRRLTDHADVLTVVDDPLDLAHGTPFQQSVWQAERRTRSEKKCRLTIGSTS